MQKRRSRAAIQAFRKRVITYWRKNGRHGLPWRKTSNPYRILVSEVMLQQTQVSRVIPKYAEFLKKFPTPHVLARAPLSDVLTIWRGMGYNRRAKFLRDAAIVVAEKYNGRIPADYHTLRELPGVGDYTARAIRAFAFDVPEYVIETNIRAAFIHHFFPRTKRVADSQLIPIAKELAEGQPAREWNSALMDYGVYIKTLHSNPSRRSNAYAQQTKFDGSVRQMRGKILPAVESGTTRTLLKKKFKGSAQFEKALTGLLKDGLLVEKQGRITVA